MSTESKSWPLSSQVDRTDYDDKGVLTVTFKAGSKYIYWTVPKDVWEELKKAESVGTFLNKRIKPKYSVNKVE